MAPWMATAGDPGRVHHEGRVARAAVEHAREQVAALVGARPSEVVFTSGATESANAVAWGAAQRGPHAVCSPVEHSAVRDSAGRAEVTWVGVDGSGRVDPSEMAEAVRPGDTAVVHCQWGNHEVGTLQPVSEVVGACRPQGVLVHSDAAQAAGHLGVDFAGTGVDLLSLSAHKLGGPTGMGALVVRRGLRLAPLLPGGDQERARRAGTENVAGAVGFGAAAEEAGANLGAEERRARDQTAALLAAATAVEGVRPYGNLQGRLPHVVCLGVAGVEAEAVLLGLDQAGVAVHSGSACSSESLEPSPVLAAMGVDAERSLRLSVGWPTTDADVEAFAAAFGPVVGRLRALSTTA